MKILAHILMFIFVMYFFFKVWGFFDDISRIRKTLEGKWK